MGNPKTAALKSGAASSRSSSPHIGARRFSSGSDLWPEVSPEESSRRAVHRKKSLSTSRDQLLYLQALFPYAPYDELMSVISKTDGPDEAAQHAYEALNPNYTGYLYLKEQTEVMRNSKSSKAQRASAFSGLKEALEERATDAFRPGMFSNLSQLHEYHETVGLFVVDTTEWDRAMLLPARDLAEMAFMDLPLREEVSSPSSSSSGDEGTGLCGRGSDQRAKSHLLSMALGGSNARFMDASFVTPRAHSFDTTLLPQASVRDRRGDVPRDGCKTPVASTDASPAAAAASSQPPLHPHTPKEAGVLYLQDSDPVCKAPIIAWAPEAIRVGPAEALRQQEGALRVFDEATFFKDPLLARDPSSILLMTPDPKAARRPQGPPETFPVNSKGGARLPPFLAVSPNNKPPATRELHEPIDSPDNSVRFVMDDDNDGEGDGRSSEGDEDERNYEETEVPSPLPRGYTERRSSGETAETSAIEVVCDPALLERRRRQNSTLLSSHSMAPHARELVASPSEVPVPLATQPSLRESTVEALRSRRQRPITSSEKVKQRMRTLKPVGNLVFREASELSPLAVSPEHTFVADPRSPVPSLPLQALLGSGRTDEETFTDPSMGARTQRADPSFHAGRNLGDDSASPVIVVGSGGGGGARTRITTTSAAAAAAAAPSSPAGQSHGRVCGQVATIPQAHAGCSSLDPAAYLNQEEGRWSCIVEMLKPFEEVFGAKFRCELVRCVYDDCVAIRSRLTEILRRLLHVVGLALAGKEVADGLTEAPLDLPLFGSILLSTSAVKLQELVLREEKCELSFCEEGTRLRVRLHVRRLRLEPIQFAYIDEADAARQNRVAQQARLRIPQPRSRATAWTLRHSMPATYKDNITRGTATVSASNVKLKGVVYVWLMASGRVCVTFQEAHVSVGSLKVSTDVPKLNVFFTLMAPVVKLLVERAVLDAVKSVHTF